MKSIVDGLDGVQLLGESAMHLPFLGSNHDLRKTGASKQPATKARTVVASLFA
jgi:hypothetical protein